MIALLLMFLDTSVHKGDSWVTERTFSYLQSSGNVDQSSVERLEYSVVAVGQEKTIWSTSATPKISTPTTPKLLRFEFRPSGVLLSQEDASNPDLERVNRIVWTCLEDRKGLSWSRKWPDIGNLVSAEVEVKPASKTDSDKTYHVTYREAGTTRGVATVKVFNQVRIVEDFSLTLNNVRLSGNLSTGSLVVTEKLKSIHLSPR